jgi:hypothetical protein
LFEASNAVTVKGNAVPAVAIASAVTEKCVAVAGEVVLPPPPPPQPLRRHNPRRESTSEQELFITPPQEGIH